MNQNTKIPRKLANARASWHKDAVKNIALPVSFGFHGGAKRENVLFIKDPGENSGYFCVKDHIQALCYPDVRPHFFPDPQGFAHEVRDREKSEDGRLEGRKMLNRNLRVL